MSLLEKLLGKRRTEEKKVEQPPVIVAPVVEKVPEPTSAPTPAPAGTTTLNLSKEIGLNLNKLNLDKPEVLAKNLFLLDVSGSMNNRVGKERKIEHLRDVMSKYPDANMLCFSSNVVSVKKADDIPNPNGGTDLAHALEYIARDKASLLRNPERIVLISDGEPDSKHDALEKARILGLPIDIIFIGEEGSDGHQFMEELAKQTGGQHFVV